MKRLFTIIGTVLVIGILAIPVMALNSHWGSGHHMMGSRNNGSWSCIDNKNLTTEQKSKLDALDRKFYDETADLRDQIRTKSEELNTVLNNTTPDLAKAKTLQKEISKLQTTLDEKGLNYELEARKIVPDLRFGNNHHMGTYGHHMGTYGHGMMTRGPGYCWN